MGWNRCNSSCLRPLQAEAPSDSEEEDEFVYNPLKLPLGYDGKPIPYWLYKLHGLNQVWSPKTQLHFALDSLLRPSCAPM